MLRKQKILSLLVFLPMIASAAIDDASVKVNWGYKGDIGPEKWGQLSSSFQTCATGKHQSPINIRKTNPSPSNELAIHYARSPLSIIDDGSMMLKIGSQEILVKSKGLQVDFSKDTSETLTFEGVSYQLQQFHFHSPSETTLHERAYPLEIHFVHQNKQGEAIVLAVFIRGGEENQTLKQILTHMPKQEGKIQLYPNDYIDPAKLLPNKLHYYSFAGSLTTPPCTEGVKWVVLAEPIMASPAQIMMIRKAVGGGNARPVQPLNGRIVSHW